MLDFAFHKIISSLKSLGITAVIISLAVFFSAFSSMALLTMSDQFLGVTVKDPDISFGGNVSVNADKATLEKLELELQDLKTSGKITQMTQKGQIYGVSAQSSKVKELMMMNLVGINDNSYPLYGYVNVEGGLYNSVKEPNTISISNDLAKKLEVKVGDTIQILPSNIFESKSLKVTSIIEDTNVGAGQAYVNMGTMEMFGYFNRNLLIKGDEKAISEKLASFFASDALSVTSQTLSGYIDSQEKSSLAFTLVFRGLSILGIFIGSMGIASSMQVIISRRKREIGIMKAIGYTERNITLLYLLELLVLALPGILLGIVGGHFLSRYILNLFTTIGMNIAFETVLNLKVAGITFLASLGSALIFGFYSISKFASFSIVDALRENSNGKGKGKWKNFLLIAVIAILFAGISILITGDWKYGLIAVGVAGAGTLIFSLIFQFIFWLILRLPLNTGNTFEMAWINLRNSYKKNILAVMAIFIGITAIGFIICLIKTSKEEMSSQTVDLKSTVNVVSVRDYDTNTQLTDVLKNNNFNYDTEYVKVLSTDGFSYFYYVSGRDMKDKYLDINITEGSLKEGKYVVILDMFKVEEGFAIGNVVTLPEGGDFEISGYYTSNTQQSDTSGGMSYSLIPDMPFAIVTKTTFMQYFKGNIKEVALVVTDSNTEENAVNVLNGIDGNVVLSTKATEDYMNSMFDMITKMVFSVAGLALLAGGILLLNSTSLEIISRKRSFGLLKVVGFMNKQVKAMLFLEYGLIFIITFAISYLTVWGGVTLLSKYSEQIFGYKYTILFAGTDVLYLMLGFGVLIFVLIWSVAIKYLNTRPVEVLRYE
jgi:putative ABC transport system permease protein